MKRATLSKRRMGSLIVKNLIILLVVVIASFVGTKSWFTHTTRAYASGVNVSTQFPPDIEIAIVPKGYNNNQPPDINSNLWKKGSIELNYENYPNLFAELFLSDIDGDGTYFYKPLMTQNADGARPDVSSQSVQKWSTATATKDYLGFDIYARTAKDAAFTKLKMQGTSSISPKSALTTTPSYDMVIGAVRFSFGTTSSNTKIWIPAPHVHYNAEATPKTLSLTYKSSNSFNLPCIDSGTSYKTGNGFAHYYYQVSGPSSNRTATFKTFPAARTVFNSVNNDSNLTNNSYTLGSDQDFITFNGGTTGAYKWGKTTCNLWIEGEDTEARLASVEGKFNVNLKFTAN